MRHDILDQFSVQQTLAGSAAQVSTNSKVKENADQDLAIGCAEMGAVIAIDKGALGGTGTDLTIELIEASDAALTTSVKVFGTMTIPKAQLVDGAQFFLPAVPYRMSEKYYGVRYTPVGGTITGDINAYWGSKNDVAKYKSFKTPYNVQN